MEGLFLDIEKWGPQLAHKKLTSIYFGGGTPSLLGAGPLKKLLDRVQTFIPFNPNEIEITLEANPESITASLIKNYADAGVNRISIGIQTLDDTLLAKLGRMHHSKTALNAIETVASSGISNISIDLMYDIPGQTLASWQHTLQQIPQLPITHLSLYNLTIEPHTVFFKYREKLQKELPDADSSTAMYQNALTAFENCGLKQYEISAFAKRDLYSRHNVGYWTARPFIGFGPSAFSYWHGRRFRSAANLQRYVQALRQNTSPEDFTEELSPEKMRCELLVIALRLCKGINKIDFENEHGILSTSTLNTLKNLEKDGFIDIKEHAISLSKKGVLFYDTVAVELI